MRFAGVLDNLVKVRNGMTGAFGEGREDNRRAFVNAREDKGDEAEPARAQSMFGQNRTITGLRELIGIQGDNPNILEKIFKADKASVEARRQMGMELSSDPATKLGQVIGHLGADLVQDRSREAWWLLNAPQAVGNVLNEVGITLANPNIFNKMDVKYDSKNNPLTIKSPEAVRAGAVDEKSGRLKKGWQIQKQSDGTEVLAQRRYDPGNTAALGIPVGLAINSGIGLMNPYGGQEGYQAAIPSEEDRSKTDNVLAEVASKYILGRTGNMLPWSEFQQVRPDVSKDEYMRYKAFKFDKEGDMNPFDDGQMTLPSGVVKYNNDGIHGAEVQFLGRSLPLHTAIAPAALGILGTMAGVRQRKNKLGEAIGRPIRDGFIGGMSGAIGGMAIGNSIEDERRRRNAAENKLDTIDK